MDPGGLIWVIPARSLCRSASDQGGWDRCKKGRARVNSRSMQPACGALQLRSGETMMCPLKRPWHEMPEFVENALREHGLMEAYRSRPPYQRNDYVGWITGAKRWETQQKRLAQMISELQCGDRYMNMVYRPRSKG